MRTACLVGPDAQALEAIKIASGVGEVLSKKLLIFDALAGRRVAEAGAGAGGGPGGQRLG
jgi:hypothetical protein